MVKGEGQVEGEVEKKRERERMMKEGMGSRMKVGEAMMENRWT